MDTDAKIDLIAPGKSKPFLYILAVFPF